GLGRDWVAHDLWAGGMFQGGDILVQAVMVGLAIASVVTWTVWLAKTIELLVAKRRMRQALVTLARAGSLRQAAERIDPGSIAGRFIEAAVAEMHLSADLTDRD